LIILENGIAMGIQNFKTQNDVFCYQFFRVSRTKTEAT
jgi:hypothetical protein